MVFDGRAPDFFLKRKVFKDEAYVWHNRYQKINKYWSRTNQNTFVKKKSSLRTDPHVVEFELVGPSNVRK